MDNQLKVLGQVTENLEEIRAFKFPECPHSFAAVLLRFQTLSVIIGVDDSTDEILVLNEVPEDALEVKDSDSLNLLKRAIGRHFGWVWRLKNQQGYFDGVQFSFILDDSSEPAFVFQLIAVSSGLDLIRCENIPTNS
jgi:hypothetical protein